ncbi:MAG TPA: N-acetylmuramoyl-L-alanine amidase [Vicinamibacterales bacterium]|nr:N-acetylmuramoyl-L-alanine amidase [Vicinamibacterales bacterium]
MTILYGRATIAWVLLAALSGAPTAQAPQTPVPYTVLSREARRPLAARMVNGQEMFAVDDLARLFGLTLAEDAIAGGLTITSRGQSILLSPGQELVSVSGRLVSLPTPPVREGRAWFVPVDFVSRALAPVAGFRVELRKPSRLILSGDIRVPRVAGRIELQGTALARLTLDVAPATPHSVTQEANRLVVRFEADALDAALPQATAPDLIQHVRAEGASSLAIDLGPRFASFRTSDLPGDRGATRIVVDVVAQATDQGQLPVPPPPPQEAPPLLEITPSGGLRSVVIDAGHGGAEHGARDADGGNEKTVTMAVARRLKAALEARLGVRVILTRDGDTAVPLDQRAAVANNNKVDLFISLHANASVRASAAGAEVFYLSLDAYGDDALRAATAPRETLPVFGGGSRDIEAVQWQFAQARHIEQSAALARAVEASLRTRVPMSPRALQQAPFRVLVGANMPAVLVEMGFMTNPAQAKQLASEQYQNDVVQSLVDAIVTFRDARGGIPPPPPSVPGAVR